MTINTVSNLQKNTKVTKSEANNDPCSPSRAKENNFQEYASSMLKRLTRIECTIVCTLMLSPILSNCNNDNKKSQNEGNSIKDDSFEESKLFTTEFPASSDRVSLKMLEDITTKVWRILPVVDIAQHWAITYCLKDIEISEEIEKAVMQCQHGGTDWDCVFIELGGGVDDFNMGKIVSLFHDLSDRELRTKLLRSAEVCGKLWQRYKRFQKQRLTRMGLNIHVKDRRKRSLTKNRRSRAARAVKKNAKKKNKDAYIDDIRKAKEEIDEMKNIRRNLISEIEELENKRSLDTEEKKEQEKSVLKETTKPPMNLEKYSLTDDRTEMARLQSIGTCLSRQVTKACESTVLKAVEKLI